ncbi:DUF4232 domain-containing protein [Streptomyces sp. NPDC050504]|uniref:DUF4232 domain-containing protein n=1 Tax=Streptomyces sp. NPDC050504 TaxID=3365618 RepID=UPI00379CB5B6
MRPTALLALSVTAASALLLAGCAEEDAASGSRGRSASPAECVTTPPVGDAGDLKRDGVTVLGRDCDTPAGSLAEYEVTNTAAEPLTYTVTFSLRDDLGRAMDSVTRTVEAVRPGQTVRRTVEPDGGMVGEKRLNVGVMKVRTVPAGEAPAESGPCPASGMRVTADRGDAAMGLRVVGLHLANCGTAVVGLHGYPRLELLDDQRKPVSGIRILDGTREISTGVGQDGPPRPITLRPGERASATLAWRNTTGTGAAVNVPYLRVTAKPGAPTVIVTPELDLGTTGRLGVSPWAKTEDAPRTR